jgi:hypothetical protein
LLETTILIGDAVIVSQKQIAAAHALNDVGAQIDRLWLIWNRNLGVVVVPAALWLGAVGKLNIVSDQRKI